MRARQAPQHRPAAGVARHGPDALVLLRQRWRRCQPDVLSNRSPNRRRPPWRAKTEQKGDDKHQHQPTRMPTRRRPRPKKPRRPARPTRRQPGRDVVPDTCVDDARSAARRIADGRVDRRAAAAGCDDPNMRKVVSSNDKVGEHKKVDFLTEELMSRKPLDEKARDAHGGPRSRRSIARAIEISSVAHGTQTLPRRRRGRHHHHLRPNYAPTGARAPMNDACSMCPWNRPQTKDPNGDMGWFDRPDQPPRRHLARRRTAGGGGNTDVEDGAVRIMGNARSYLVPGLPSAFLAAARRSHRYDEVAFTLHARSV